MYAASMDKMKANKQLELIQASNFPNMEKRARSRTLRKLENVNCFDDDYVASDQSTINAIVQQYSRQV